MSTKIAPEMVPYASAGVYAFGAEHAFAFLEDPEVLEEHAEATWRDFEALSPDESGRRLAAVLQAVAKGNCLGCREVSLRIVMMIEDLEVQDQHDSEVA